MVWKQEISIMDFPKSFNSKQSIQQSEMAGGEGKEKNYGKNTSNRKHVSNISPEKKLNYLKESPENLKH